MGVLAFFISNIYSYRRPDHIVNHAHDERCLSLKLFLFLFTLVMSSYAAGCFRATPGPLCLITHAAIVFHTSLALLSGNKYRDFFFLFYLHSILGRLVPDYGCRNTVNQAPACRLIADRSFRFCYTFFA